MKLLFYPLKVYIECGCCSGAATHSMSFCHLCKKDYPAELVRVRDFLNEMKKL
jgi:hypothetical protein